MIQGGILGLRAYGKVDTKVTRIEKLEKLKNKNKQINTCKARNQTGLLYEHGTKSEN